MRPIGQWNTAWGSVRDDAAGATAGALIGITSVLACGTDGLFPHQGKEALYLTAIALKNRREFGALRDCHTDTLDDNVADFVEAVSAHQSPVDLDRRSAAWADHVGRDNNAIAVASATTHFHCLAAKVRQPRRVHENDIVLEQLHEFLLLLVAGSSPVTAENEPRKPTTIEIGAEQLAEALNPDGCVSLVIEQIDGAVPQLVHERDGIGGIYRRCCCKGCSRYQGEETAQKGTAHHFG